MLTSSLDPASETYRTNRDAQLRLLEELAEQLELARAGGGPRYAQRHRDRGRLLARERIELLLDRDAHFLELSTLAAWGTEFTVGASLVTGIGVVSGVECVLIAHDPTVRGGAMNPYSLRKSLRALEIARRNRLPVINLVESGGADLPTQSDLFVPAGKIFHDLTELSAMGVPTIALVFGNSTAGGAYVPGMCDYCGAGGRAGQGVPRRPAAGQDGHRRGLRRRGAGRGPDARPGVRAGRLLRRRRAGRHPDRPADRGRPELAQAGAGADRCPRDEPVYDPDELLGIAPADIRVPFDPREVLARVVDGSRFGEYKAALRHQPGHRLGAACTATRSGILANARGVLFSEESKKAAEFILLANQTDTPLVFLQNTTGYMVGTAVRAGRDHQGRRQDDQRGDQQHGAAHHAEHGRLVRGRQLRHVRPGLRPAAAVRLAQRPARRDGRRSSWPGCCRSSARPRPSPPAGRSTPRPTSSGGRRSRRRSSGSRTPSSSPPGSTTTALIDPRDTRTVLGIALSAAHSAPVEGRRGFGVFRM